MSNKLAPIVVPVVVDSSGVDKGMRTAKNKMRAGAAAAGSAGVIGGGGGGDGGGIGFASIAFGAAIGARQGSLRTMKGFKGQATTFLRKINEASANKNVFAPGATVDDFVAKIAAGQALRAEEANRTAKLFAVRRGLRKGIDTPAFGALGTQPGRVINSIGGALGIKEAFRAVGPVGLGVGAAAMGIAALGNYNQTMLNQVGSLPMNYRLNSPQFAAAMRMKERQEATERPEAGFMARLALANPALGLSLDALGTVFGTVFSAETAGAIMPQGMMRGVSNDKYSSFVSQRYEAFRIRNFGTPQEVEDLKREQRRQSRILQRTAI